MELFAYLQIAEAYERSNTDDLVDLADRFYLPSTPLYSMTPQAEQLRIAGSNQARLRILLAITAVWSTGLSGTALAVEEYNPGFRAGSADPVFVPVAPVTVRGRTVPIDCANALCSAACGDANSTAVRPINNPTIVRPIAVNVSDNTFVAVRPSQPAGGVFLRRGDVGPEITRLQDLLRSAGYFDAASTGFFASLTEAGVRAFQRDRGLDVDGIVGEETLAALQGFRPVTPAPLPAPVPLPEINSLQIGDRGENVVRLQLSLRNAGFYRNAIDGVFAAQTEQAVISFQRANGLPISGIADAVTLSRLGVTVDRIALQ